MSVVFEQRDALGVGWSQYADEELVGEFRFFGEDRCFEELVRRYRTDLVRFLKARFRLREYAAEEIASTTFARVWQKLDRFDLTRRFKPWLFRVAYTQAVDYVRSERRRVFASLDAPRFGDDAGSRGELFLAGRDADPQTAAELSEARLAVARLPEPLRLVVEQVFLEGRTRREVAASLNVAPDAVSRRLAKALRMLGAFFAREGVPRSSAASLV